MIELTVNYIKLNQVLTKEKTGVPGEAIWFGLRYRCTSLVPCPSFYRYFSYNSDPDEVESFDSRTLSEDEVFLIAHELGSLWKMFGRALNVPDAVIDQIEANKFQAFDKCYSKCNWVLIVGNT